MKKIYLLLLLLVLAIVSPVARAEVVSPYSFGFSGLDTSSHSFAPYGWGHIVESYYDDSYYETEYVAYTQKEYFGVDDGPCLLVGSQNLGSYYGGYQDVYDLLVSPLVSGKVTISVRQSQGSGNIEFYACSLSGTTYTKGEKLTATYPDGVTSLNTSTHTVLTINLSEPTYVGIRGEYVYIDDFTAEQAEIIPKREAKLSSVTMTPTDKAAANAEGNIIVTLTGTLTNSGDATLTIDDEDFSVAVYNWSTSTAYDAVPVNTTLAAGESTTVTATATIPVTEYLRQRFDLKENVSSTTAYGGWLDLYPNVPVFEFALNTAADAITSGTEIAFGTTKDTDVEKKIYIINTTGGATLNVTNAVVPDGFSIVGIALDETDAVSTTTFPFAIPAFKRAILTVAMDNNIAGNRTGNITISAVGFENAIFPVSGMVINPSKVYETFEGGLFPNGSLVEYSGASKSWTIEKHSYASKCMKNGGVSPETKAILPKMAFASGDVLMFDAAARSSSTSFLNVYISADRKNFTLLKSINTTSEDESCKFSTDRYSTSSSFDTWKFKTFTVNVPEGEWYVAFSAGYCWVDNIVGGTLLPLPENETIIYGVTIPEEATCNHSYEIAGQLFNLTAADFAEGEYVARFYIGEEMVGEKLISDVAKSGASRFSITVTPHKAGTFVAHLDIVKVADGTVINTLTGSQTVAEEVIVGEQQVGNATGTSSSSPVYTNWKNSNTETVYLASEINLPAETAIHGLNFKGYNTSADWTTHLTVYIENTSDEVPNETEMSDVSKMTLLYDGDYTFKKSGSSSNYVNLLDLTFNEDFIYTGGNIRIVCCNRTNNYKSFNFVHDKNVTTQTRQQHWDDGNPTAWSTTTMPVVYFYVDKEASTLSGTVTDGTNPVEGAEVKIADGDVYYKGTTDAEGKYSFTVYQDKRNYSLTVKKSGYFDYSDEINLNGGALVKDIVLQDASGFKLLSATFPTNGEVNSAMTVTAQLLNGVEKREGSYSAALYVNDEIVASAPAYAMGENATVDFSFSYTPHVVGDVTAYVKFAIDDIVAQSEPATISIAEEKAVAEQQVGAHSTSSKNGPAYLFYKRSKTELIYPKSYINLPAGTAIQSIKFKGYVSSAKSAIFTYNAWMGNVAEGTALQGETTEGMTQIMTNREETYNEVKGSNSEFVDILTIDLPEGFVYDGGDLRFFFTCEGTEYTGGVYFDVTSITGQAKQGSNDNSTLENISLSNSIPLPVLYLGMDPKKTVSGAITNRIDAPVEGAKVTLKSGDVEYYGTADANGDYSIDVIKHSLDYTMSVSAEMYDTANENVSFAEGDVTKNVMLELLDGNYIVCGNLTYNGEPAQNYVVNMTQNGVNVGKATSDATGRYVFAPRSMSGDAWALIFNNDSGYDTEKINLATAEYGIIVVGRTLENVSGGSSISTDGITAYGAKGAIIVKAPKTTVVNIYNAAGVLMRSVDVESGITRLDGFTAGLYLVGTTKVAVK